MAQPTHQWQLPERSWREQDLSDLPENGNRYEIIDGSLHVTPPASPEHHELAEHYELLGTLGPEDPVNVDEPWPIKLDPSIWPR
ncbi:hypothetical protein O7634_03185 [Micromonospora sp. WMMD1120]|uniref:hypothetical protein n=1 Tax=Micromonospora sp. WMMD1120 TaxID=3016106 RepID=UPI00241691E0|nr:hypothetical protein [Micromonospora sp. WMMD1120]MDG4805757.1 hypothetical protein [Micromonospora sp. WMMD1120]